MATLRYFIDKVLTRLSMEGGVDTQIYTEQRIVMAIQYRFDYLFLRYWMEQFMTFNDRYVLDNVTGTVVGDLSAKIKRIVDVRCVWNDFTPYPLPRAPTDVRIQDITDPCIQTVVDKTKVFRILPITSTGAVEITYRTKPNNFVGDGDEVDMDESLMIYGVAADILDDDGTNPGAADKFRMQADMMEKELSKAQFNFSQSASPRRTTNDRWR